MKKLNILNIRTDGGTQPRLKLDQDLVKEYAEVMREGVVFPPVEVFHDGSEYWLVDGFHRYFGYKANGLTSIEAIVHTGTLREAQFYAWKANNKTQVLADNKVRRRKHREATPPWLTRKQKSEIRQLYQIAITMTQTTGEQYVVDHIVPLRSHEVCGLYVPWNLRVITQEENLKKSNKLVAPE